MESSNLRNLRSRTIGSPNLPKTPIKAPPNKKNKDINLGSIVYKIKFSSINTLNPLKINFTSRLLEYEEMLDYMLEKQN